MTDTYTINDHFADKDPIVRALYDKLLAVLNTFGPIIEEPKKTSIHFVRKSALAGVETRKSYLLLNIKADHKIDSPRISQNRPAFRQTVSSQAQDRVAG